MDRSQSVLTTSSNSNDNFLRLTEQAFAMSNAPDLPAINWLGYTLDMTSITPQDVRGVLAAVKKTRRMIRFSGSSRNLNVDGTIYNVPGSIYVSQDAGNAHSNYITYKDGSIARTAFATDASLQGRYMAVSGGASVSYSVDKSFSRNSQYALYSMTCDMYLAGLQDFIDDFNEAALLARLEELPAVFSPTSEKEVADFRGFFNSIGSHIILTSTYGARFTMDCWITNANTAINEKFSADVNAAFNGISSGGKFDGSVKKESQYQTFVNTFSKDVVCQGGSTELGVQIDSDPYVYENYNEWTKTMRDNPNVMNLTLIEIWTLMRDAASKFIRDRANTIQRAYEWVVSHPRVCRTAVTFTIFSDWGEFGLTSPDARITVEGPVDNTSWTTSKVTWGREHSHDQKRTVVNFYIHNDGSPVDFYLSHGSDGSKSGNGEVQITMEGGTYLNNQKVDNNWNTMRFYQAIVSNIPAEGSVTARGTHRERTWDEALDEYFEEIGKPRPEIAKESSEVDSADEVTAK